MSELIVTECRSWLSDEVDQDLPSWARINDYLLGGGRNFAADRQVAERFAAALPGSRHIARLNRAFLRRAVLFTISAGVRQFLDIGSGVPTVGNVHEIAQKADPRSRVVYVDVEPVAVANSKVILEGNECVTAIQADLNAPDSILAHPGTRRLIDFDEPLGLLMVGALHFVPEDNDPDGLLDHYRGALAAGSYLALSHFTADVRAAEMAAMVEVMKRTKDPIYPRTRVRFTELFNGFELVEPGVVSAALWRPDTQDDLANRPERDQILAGVARKPR